LRFKVTTVSFNIKDLGDDLRSDVSVTDVRVVYDPKTLTLLSDGYQLRSFAPISEACGVVLVTKSRTIILLG
jgi:hypothetical protein